MGVYILPTIVGLVITTVLLLLLIYLPGKPERDRKEDQIVSIFLESFQHGAVQKDFIEKTIIRYAYARGHTDLSKKEFFDIVTQSFEQNGIKREHDVNEMPLVYKDEVVYMGDNFEIDVTYKGGEWHIRVAPTNIPVL